MKRLFVFLAAFFACCSLSGCANEDHAGLVSDTINMIGTATDAIKNIKNRVREATESAAKSGKKLDLTDAIKATEQLKAISEDVMKPNGLKSRIEKVRNKITDDERKAIADSEKESLNQKFAELKKARAELRSQLAEAAKLRDSTQIVEGLRDKIREAESPFESIAR